MYIRKLITPLKLPSYFILYTSIFYILPFSFKIFKFVLSIQYTYGRNYRKLPRSESQMNAFTLKDFIEGGTLLLTYIVQKPIFI